MTRPPFADTWFFLALLDPRDGGHAQARAHLRTASLQFVTTHAVVCEVLDAITSRYQRERVAAAMAEFLRAPDAQFIPISDALFERGLAHYQKHSDKGWSLTDCLSMLVMADFGLTEVLTADHHFAQAGYHCVFLTDATRS